MDKDKEIILASYTARKLRYYASIPAASISMDKIHMYQETLHVFTSDMGMAGTVLGFKEEKNKKNNYNIYKFDLDMEIH